MDIVLTHMQTIGAGFHYNFWVVIDDQRNSKAFADRYQWESELKNLLWFIILCPQLEDFHTPLEHLSGDSGCFRKLDITHVKDAVESAIL